jgi:hypothetical protein
MQVFNIHIDSDNAALAIKAPSTQNQLNCDLLRLRGGAPAEDHGRHIVWTSLYQCKPCGFQTDKLGNMRQHESSVKHIRNTNAVDPGVYQCKP